MMARHLTRRSILLGGAALAAPALIRSPTHLVASASAQSLAPTSDFGMTRLVGEFFPEVYGVADSGDIFSVTYETRGSPALRRVISQRGMNYPTRRLTGVIWRHQDGRVRRNLFGQAGPRQLFAPWYDGQSWNVGFLSLQPRRPDLTGSPAAYAWPDRTVAPFGSTDSTTTYIVVLAPAGSKLAEFFWNGATWIHREIEVTIPGFRRFIGDPVIANHPASAYGSGRAVHVFIRAETQANPEGEILHLRGDNLHVRHLLNDGGWHWTRPGLPPGAVAPGPLSGIQTTSDSTQAIVAFTARRLGDPAGAHLFMKAVGPTESTWLHLGIANPRDQANDRVALAALREVAPRQPPAGAAPGSAPVECGPRYGSIHGFFVGGGGARPAQLQNRLEWFGGNYIGSFASTAPALTDVTPRWTTIVEAPPRPTGFNGGCGAAFFLLPNEIFVLCRDGAAIAQTRLSAPAGEVTITCPPPQPPSYLQLPQP